jgi:hypothetical protein
VGVAAPLIARLAAPPLGGHGLRLKGGGDALTVYIDEGGAGRVLGQGEPVPAGAHLRLGLSPHGKSQAAVLLLDADGAAVLYAGPAVSGPLPGAFEWTGSGAATLVTVLSDGRLDAAALADRVAKDGPQAAASPGTDVGTLKLTRSAR